jgi:formylglycine-generating enzyme required for sulfatase activity
MQLPASALLDPLRHACLLSPERLEEAVRLAASLAEATDLAAELVRRGWLTAYQGGELSEGRGYALLFGPYVLMQKLGEGGFGEVFRAWHRHMDCERAVKRMHPHLARQPEFAKRFLREGRAVARLAHDNVVKIHDVNEAGGTFYLAMEYLSGVNLAAHLGRVGSLPVAEAVDYVRQACEGMQHAHEQGIVHRDLKPGNLMLTQGRIKVLDLGLARLPTDETLSETGQFLGTAEYASPEQMSDFSTADVRADVYSLGCTLYHALAGRTPFSLRGVDWESRIRKVKHEEPPPIGDFRDNVPREVCEVVRKMMAKKPEGRHQTPGEAAAALAALRRGGAAGQGGGRVAPASEANRASADPPSQSPETEMPGRSEAGPSPTRTEGAAPGAAPEASGRGLVEAAAAALAGRLWRKLWGPTESTPAGGPLPGSFTNSIGMRLVLVRPGKFLMGSPADEAERGGDEQQHEVTITKPFYLGVCPVTQGQWKAVMGNNPAWFGRGGKGDPRVKGAGDAELEQFPVECVSWEDAQAFLKRLAALREEARNGREYRLPSEAEWEYACRGGPDWSPLPFHIDHPCSSLSSTQANFDGNSPYGRAPRGPNLARPCKVGSYEPNSLGLYDVHGNVWEWCSDWFGPYPSAPVTDPLGPSDGAARVVRGGSWRGNGMECRAASRVRFAPSGRLYYLGFRVALTPHE